MLTFFFLVQYWIAYLNLKEKLSLYRYLTSQTTFSFFLFNIIPHDDTWST